MTQKEQILYELFGFDPNHINYLINISDKYKYIYFETPKVGCSTIKRTLQKMEVDSNSQMPTDVHEKNLSPLLSPLQLENNFTHYINDEYFKFSFVRNPYTRILSCYLDKIVTNLDEKQRMLPKLGLSPTDKISFKVFLLAIKEQSYSKMDPHWMPQSILLASNYIVLDYIGRQENFDNDLKKALAIINKTEPEENNIANEAPHAVGANKKLQEYMTKEIIELIQEIYADDFSLYGYSKNPFSTEVLPPIDINTYKENELVSIVIPCYNQAQYLEESVQSCIDQTYSNIEIIIINDGSTDNTQEIALLLQEKYPEKIKIILQENTGLPEARNNAIKQSTGTYILPLDADDKISKYMVSKSIKVLNDFDVDIASTGYQFFGDKTNSSIPKDFCESNLLYTNCAVVCSLYRRKVWTTTEGYKKNMHGGYEDWEFWINAYKHGFKFKRFFEILFYYRIKKESMYTDAIKKDLYLKSKLVMNHPEIYPLEHVKRSVQVISDSESLADLYFYAPIDFLGDQKYLIEAISHHLTSQKLQEIQYIDIPNSDKKIILTALDSLKDNKHFEKLCEDAEANLVLFYSSLRYEVPTLKNLNFSWDNDTGSIETKGSIFPFVFKSIREDEKLQLIAYQRFYKYNTEVFEPKTRQQTSIYKQRIENREKMIQNRDKTIINREKTIQKKEHLNRKQITTINKVKKEKENVVRLQALFHPIKKYKAYKNLIKQISKI